MEQPKYLLYALAVMAAYGLWLVVTKRLWREEETDPQDNPSTQTRANPQSPS